MNRLESYLFISSILAALGVVTIASRRNAVAILMGIELLLNAAALNFVAFGRFVKNAAGTHPLDGQIFAIFIIVLAAAEAVILLAVIIAIYRQVESIDADRLRELKG
ncbi:MAG: NADH-quinone oxidoreductase subunit NuoK [Candidatus Eisenbacteria bacterium]|nr:NADH-quinone oxidoreductase subunit NuoK [Candidatus Eisenbacteria bacterium]